MLGLDKFEKDDRTHSEETPIRVLKVQHGGPVIRFIFNESAGRAGRYTWEIVFRVHRDVEAGM